MYNLCKLQNWKCVLNKLKLSPLLCGKGLVTRMRVFRSDATKSKFMATLFVNELVKNRCRCDLFPLSYPPFGLSSMLFTPLLWGNEYRYGLRCRLKVHFDTLAALFMASHHENTFLRPPSETKHNPAVKTSLTKIETIVANRYMTATVESQFLDPTKETKIGSRNCGGSKKFIQGKRKLVWEIRRFEKSRVQEIGIPLYIQVYLSKMSSESSNMTSIQHVFAVVKTQ